MEENNLKDKILICKDCHSRFVFTVKEQMDFGQKMWPDPVRCKVCRRTKKMVKDLNDGVIIGDSIQIKEICDWCGRSFNSAVKREKGKNLFCDDCWNRIKHEKFWEKNTGLGNSQT